MPEHLGGNVRGLRRDLTVMQGQVPLASDLVVGVLLPSLSASDSIPVFVAPFPCLIPYAVIVNVGSSTIAASDEDYWTVEIKRIHATTHSAIATKTTKTTGGQAITRYVAWDFGAVTFDADAALLAADDVVEFVFTKTGSPGSLANALLEVRYEPR